MTSYPRRVWFDTGNGWASRQFMPPDFARREIMTEILESELPAELVRAGELRMAELWDHCRLFQKPNETGV